MKVCTDLRIITKEGNIIFQAKWQPIQFSGTYTLQLSGEEADWTDLATPELAELASPQEEFQSDPVAEVPKTLVSEETKKATLKASK